MTDENSLSDDDITTSRPTEDDEDRDVGNEGRDTGDLPTENDDDRDKSGEGTQDTGDEA